MKQEEKSKKSREHILSHAFAEFARQGHAAGSVNAVCTRGQISKGLLYHYYSDKDALYLACVERCFQALTDDLKARLDPATVTPEQYFDVRLAFFRFHPEHQRLFCDTVVNPHPGLEEALRACRAPFDALNETMLTAILEKKKLADGLTIRDALEQLRLFEDLISSYLRISGEPAQQLERHNELCRQTLHTLLYGLTAHL